MTDQEKKETPVMTPKEIAVRIAEKALREAMYRVEKYVDDSEKHRSEWESQKEWDERFLQGARNEVTAATALLDAARAMVL